MRGAVIAMALILAPIPAPAQEVAFDPGLAEGCLMDGGWTQCIGHAANICMETTENGFTTAAMVACLSAETEWWDRDLNATYQDILTRDAGLDADGKAPSAVEAIREVQRAWIPFRDASCQYERLRWQDGTGARLAEVGCRLQMTGEQALRLRSYLAEG